MNLGKCRKGHFYDMDIYEQCPYCVIEQNNGYEDDRTTGMPAEMPDLTPGDMISPVRKIKTVVQSRAFLLWWAGWCVCMEMNVDGITEFMKDGILQDVLILKIFLYRTGMYQEESIFPLFMKKEKISS